VEQELSLAGRAMEKYYQVMDNAIQEPSILELMLQDHDKTKETNQDVFKKIDRLKKIFRYTLTYYKPKSFMMSLRDRLISEIQALVKLHNLTKPDHKMCRFKTIPMPYCPTCDDTNDCSKCKGGYGL